MDLLPNCRSTRENVGNAGTHAARARIISIKRFQVHDQNKASMNANTKCHLLGVLVQGRLPLQTPARAARVTALAHSPWCLGSLEKGLLHALLFSRSGGFLHCFVAPMQELEELP